MASECASGEVKRRRYEGLDFIAAETKGASYHFILFQGIDEHGGSWT